MSVLKHHIPIVFDDSLLRLDIALQYGEQFAQQFGSTFDGDLLQEGLLVCKTQEEREYFLMGMVHEMQFNLRTMFTALAERV